MSNLLIICKFIIETLVFCEEFIIFISTKNNNYFRIVAFFTCGAMNVYPGITRGMGYSVLPMLCTLVGACILRIVWLATIFTWHPTEIILFLCYPVTWALAGLGQVAIFFYARQQIRKPTVQEAETVQV